MITVVPKLIWMGFTSYHYLTANPKPWTQRNYEAQSFSSFVPHTHGLPLGYFV
jgi:hypothetical protein